MDVIYLARGICHLGRTTTDKDGNVIESVPAHFEITPEGSAVAVGIMDAEKLVPEGAVEGVFGEWDAAGCLQMVLQLLSPRVAINVPDLKAIVQAAYVQDGSTLLCDYCQRICCMNCIIHEWMEEVN